MRCTNEEERVGLRETNKTTKREVKKAVSEAKNTTYKRMYERLEITEGEHVMFKIAKARERRRQDLEHVKFIKDMDGHVLFKEQNIKLRWKTYFENLLTMGELTKKNMTTQPFNDNNRIIATADESHGKRGNAHHKKIEEKVWEKKCDLLMVFIDLEKAYDIVPRQVLWDCMEGRGVPRKYIEIIMDMYAKSATSVRATMGDTDLFPMELLSILFGDAIQEKAMCGIALSSCWWLWKDRNVKVFKAEVVGNWDREDLGEHQGQHAFMD
ncbi:uncharacterized protein LOC143631595 [Bidens hawaiensis]|uniref:uncharacterized protein LOC143631595 n=1 Tax=Bidens hawaiensis TaxID=980011 RepID=UPI00404AF231